MLSHFTVTNPEQTSATKPTTGPSISQPASITPSYENQTRVTTRVNNNQTGITTTARNNPMTVRITRSSSERVVMEENSRAAMSFPYVSMLFGVACLHYRHCLWFAFWDASWIFPASQKMRKGCDVLNHSYFTYILMYLLTYFYWWSILLLLLFYPSVLDDSLP